jgi:uncharacterized membrane protein YgdD (TMEM256/DUF423 family)
MTIWFRIGAVVCFMAVALGAFGAHALKTTLLAHNSRDAWSTAVIYQFLHGLALIVLSLSGTSRLPYYFFLIGTVLFSGSLYLLSVFPASWLGPLTPLGGLCLLAGWALLIFRGS